MVRVLLFFRALWALVRGCYHLEYNPWAVPVTVVFVALSVDILTAHMVWSVR